MVPPQRRDTWVDIWTVAQKHEPLVKQEAQGPCVLSSAGVSSTAPCSHRAPFVGGSAPHPFQEPLLKLQGVCGFPELRALPSFVHPWGHPPYPGVLRTQMPGCLFFKPSQYWGYMELSCRVQ